VKLHANQVSLELLGVLFRLWVKIHVYVLNLDFFYLVEGFFGTVLVLWCQEVKREETEINGIQENEC